MTEQPAASVTAAGDEVTVALHGEVDVLTVEQVRVAVHESIAARPREILVDLAELSFIDSTGLGALIFGFQRARDAGIGLAYLAPASASAPGSRPTSSWRFSIPLRTSTWHTMRLVMASRKPLSSSRARWHPNFLPPSYL